jgi:hypothetical protein
MQTTVPASAPVAPDFTRPDVQAHYIELAAAHIERYGLHQGAYWPTTFGDNGLQIDDTFAPQMPCCTVGAIAVALDVHEPVDVDARILGHDYFTGDVTPHPVLAVLMHALCATEVEQVFAWSDSARDDQVVARLRYIAAQLRPEVEIPAAVA